MQRVRIFLLEKNPLNDDLNEGTPFHLFVDELVDRLLGHTWTTPRLTLILNMLANGDQGCLLLTDLTSPSNETSWQPLNRTCVLSSLM